ncbi:MAG TPA: hypothetical protein VFC93_09380 [Chloroflexota bacterium]|nr:hypothetical protein [Chloroflexota bacterium]
MGPLPSAIGYLPDTVLSATISSCERQQPGSAHRLATVTSWAAVVRWSTRIEGPPLARRQSRPHDRERLLEGVSAMMRGLRLPTHANTIKASLPHPRRTNKTPVA